MSYTAHTTISFKELEILKIPDIIDLEVIKFTYSFIEKNITNTIVNHI